MSKAKAALIPKLKFVLKRKKRELKLISSRIESKALVEAIAPVVEDFKIESIMKVVQLQS